MRQERTTEEAQETVPRRRFVDVALGTGLSGVIATLLYPLGRYLIPPKVEAATTRKVVTPFKPEDIVDNTGKIFRFGSVPGILIRTPSGELRAFSATCTHLACIVQYRPDLSHIWCACHNGHYNLEGTNIAGPPPRPLERYAVNVKGDRIVVTR